MHRENEADHKQQEKEEVNACSSIPSSSLSLSLLPAPSVPESGASLIAQHLQIDEENEEKKKTFGLSIQCAAVVACGNDKN
jgi:hypothetical protein